MSDNAWLPLELVDFLNKSCRAVSVHRVIKQDDINLVVIGQLFECFRVRRCGQACPSPRPKLKGNDAAVVCIVINDEELPHR